MNSRTFLRFLLLFFITFALACHEAGAQVFPDDKITKAVQDKLDAMAVKPGTAFVGSCTERGSRDRAIIILPVGSEEGSLYLMTPEGIYNGAGVKVGRNGLIITEGGGGEWSLRKLAFILKQLANSDFRLLEGDELRKTLSAKPMHECLGEPPEEH